MLRHWNPSKIQNYIIFRIYKGQLLANVDNDSEKRFVDFYHVFLIHSCLTNSKRCHCSFDKKFKKKSDSVKIRKNPNKQNAICDFFDSDANDECGILCFQHNSSLLFNSWQKYFQ